MIRERINNGEARMKNINQTKYQKINKPFKKMNEEEKKLHIKYLWSRVRHGVLQRNTMSFIQASVLQTQKKKIFKMNTVKNAAKDGQDADYEELDEEGEEELS